MKKKYCTYGIVVSVIIILLGILTIAGALGGDTNTASGASALYASGYAAFGGDFYTYVSNNAQEAASASRSVARNLDEIATLLKNVFGFGMIAFGLLSTCAFLVVMADCEKGGAVKEAPATREASASKPVGEAIWNEGPVTSEVPAPEPVEEVIRNVEPAATEEGIEAQEN